MRNMKRRLFVMMVKGIVLSLRNLILLVLVLVGFGMADRNVGAVHSWVSSTPSYKITVQSYNPNNILDGDINQLDIQPMQALANAGYLAYIHSSKYIQGVIR